MSREREELCTELKDAPGDAAMHTVGSRAPDTWQSPCTPGRKSAEKGGRAHSGDMSSLLWACTHSGAGNKASTVDSKGVLEYTFSVHDKHSGIIAE